MRITRMMACTGLRRDGPVMYGVTEEPPSTVHVPLRADFEAHDCDLHIPIRHGDTPPEIGTWYQITIETPGIAVP